LERHPPTAALRRSLQCDVGCTYAGGNSRIWDGGSRSAFDTKTKEKWPATKPLKAMESDVCFGSKADIGVGPRHVRFAPKSGIGEPSRKEGVGTQPNESRGTHRYCRPP